MAKFIVNWSVSTGDRLTRYRGVCKEFDTENEALEALAAPFIANEVSGVARELLTEIGKCRVIATRNHGKKIILRTGK
jgi:hypothetical protein